MNYQLSIGQSLFPSIDWTGFLSQEHSPGHGSIEWTISRSVQISIDPIELCRRRPRSGRWQGSNQWSDQDLMKEFNLPLPSLIQSVSGDARVMLKSRLPGPGSCLNTLPPQVWAGFLNTWVTLRSHQPSQLHLIFTTTMMEKYTSTQSRIWINNQIFYKNLNGQFSFFLQLHLLGLG